jgi:phosphonate transport system permease protein
VAALNRPSSARSFQAPFSSRPAARAGFLLLGLYSLYALSHLDFSWARLAQGLDNGSRFLGRMFPPDLSKFDILWTGISESLQIALLATTIGVIVSLPLGLMASRNLMPDWCRIPARSVITMCRCLHPVIVSILFVKAVGFGALAGILALVVTSMGFIGKLFAEATEEISLKQLEAVRATGAGFPNLLLFGVLPQVLPRFVGFATYQLDSNLRNSTMVGIVGAGGIGGALFSAFQRFDYDFVFTILATIVAIIVAGELIVNQVKKVFNV